MSADSRPLVNARDRAAPAAPRGASAAQGARAGAPGFNWVRFWVRAAVAMLVFNILAAILTIYVIFPWLHRTH